MSLLLSKYAIPLRCVGVLPYIVKGRCSTTADRIILVYMSHLVPVVSLALARPVYRPFKADVTCVDNGVVPLVPPRFIVLHPKASHCTY